MKREKEMNKDHTSWLPRAALLIFLLFFYPRIQKIISLRKFRYELHDFFSKNVCMNTLFTVATFSNKYSN